MNKPSWLPQPTFIQFLAKYGGAPRCETCRASDHEATLCIDHVVPRASGGTDDVSNLQCLCTRHNVMKGARPDRHWRERFYFDGEHDVSRFRTAQRAGAYDQIQEFQSWFLRPWSQISGVLYVMSWVVGAGKTLSIPALAFSLNRLVLMHGRAGAPRVDRVLVLTKEQAVRDGVAAALTTELVKYGICGSAPRVRTAPDGSVWANTAVLGTADIWVACIQSLWRKDNRPVTDLEAILARFPLIVIDEPHFAEEQVLFLVERAVQSLVFGTTGSPIKASGRTISRFVNFSQYSYTDAVENDGSLKFVPPPDTSWPVLVDEIGTEVSTMMDPGGALRETDDVDEPGYERSIVAAKTVAERVVCYVREQDDLYAAGSSMPMTLAPHRPASSEPNLVYPVHAMIRVESRAAARIIATTLNDMFSADRSRFPPHMGYAADWVCSDGKGENGETEPGRPLTTDHPWMMAKETGGKLALRGHDGRVRHAVRFLVVVGVGREGVDNPFCGVVGVGCKLSSVVEGVQRVFGRQLRSVGVSGASGCRVPPSRLDTVRIVLHRAHRNGDLVRRAAHYLLNMPDYLDALVTMDELIAGGVTTTSVEPISDEPVTCGEKIALVSVTGACIRAGTEVDVTRLAASVANGDERKAAAAEAFVRRLIAEPARVDRELRHHPEITPVTVVLRETPTAQVTDDALVRFALTRGDNFAQLATQLHTNPSARLALEGWYGEHVSQFHTGGLVASTTLEKIRKTLVKDIKNDLGRAYIGTDDMIFQLVGRAVKRVFAVPDGRSASNGSEWDTAQCHAVLLRPDVRRTLHGFVRHHLIASGACPSLAEALRYPPPPRDGAVAPDPPSPPP